MRYRASISAELNRDIVLCCVDADSVGPQQQSIGEVPSALRVGADYRSQAPGGPSGTR